MITFQVKMPDDMAAWVRAKAGDLSLSASDVIRLAVKKEMVGLREEPRQEGLAS